MRSLSLLVLLLPLAACGSDDVAVVSPDAAIDAAGCDPTTALPPPSKNSFVPDPPPGVEC